MNIILKSKAPQGYLGDLTVKVTDANGYFSVTGEVSTEQERQRGDFQTGGCIHDLILEGFPQLKPLVDLHLADTETGEPLHAADNSFYWLAGAFGGLSQRYHGGNSIPQKLPQECFDYFCRTLRISQAEGEKIATEILGTTFADYASGKSKITKTGDQIEKELRTRLDKMKDRWLSEAKAGHALMHSLLTSLICRTA